jgi:putative membrane protein
MMLLKLAFVKNGMGSTVVPMDQLGSLVLQSLVFALIGIVIFAIAFWIIVKVTPFSVRKEIEEDQNVAMAVLIGAIIIAIAIVLAAAIQG